MALSHILPTSVTNIRSLARISGLRLTTTTGVVYSGQATDTHSVQLAGSGEPVDIHWVAGSDGPRKFDPHPFSLGHVRELSIAHETFFEHPRASELDLTPLLHAIKRLEVLRIHSCLPADRYNILSPFEDNGVCPSLHTVEIVHLSGRTRWLSALLHMAIRRREAGLALRKILVSPHPGSDSPAQSYIKEFDCVTLEPSESDAA